MATPSAMADLDQLLTARGFTAELGAPITAAAFNHAGSHAGFALGDGTLRLTDANSWTTAQIHDGAILALAADPVANGFLTGGDDGKLAATALDGTITPRAAYGAKWVEHIAAWPGKNPLFAAAVGKNLHLFSGDGKPQRSLSHPSTVTGIAFDSKGKRVAAGFDTGLLLIVDTIKEKILPVCGPGRGPITALAWNHTGSHLAFGTAPGFAAVVNFANS